jgi:antitoxin (DNA-binding transcriptional repressor) of toxin-antitoxin stability system
VSQHACARVIAITCSQCLELFLQVESGVEVVEFTRHGKTVARLTPPAGSASIHQRPWESLRGSGGLAMEPEESVLDAGSFDALATHPGSVAAKLPW